jgi:hypothetical protein
MPYIRSIAARYLRDREHVRLPLDPVRAWITANPDIQLH